MQHPPPASCERTAQQERGPSQPDELVGNISIIIIIASKRVMTAALTMQVTGVTGASSQFAKQKQERFLAIPQQESGPHTPEEMV